MKSALCHDRVTHEVFENFVNTVMGHCYHECMVKFQTNLEITLCFDFIMFYIDVRSFLIISRWVTYIFILWKYYIDRKNFI